MNRYLLSSLLILCVLPAAADDSSPLENALRATFRIHQNNNSGTAFLVAAKREDDRLQHFIVTANHVFDGFPEAECRLILREKQEDGTFVRRPTPVRIRQDNKALWTRHPDLDVAALPFELPEKIDAQPIPLEQIADEKFLTEKKVQVGHEVWISCFPAQFESNGAGWPILRRGTIASHPILPVATQRTLLLDYSHFGGDSGAPVFVLHDDKPVIVALTFAMARQTDRAVTPFEERVMHMPLGLALSIQGAYLKETVERALKGN